MSFQTGTREIFSNRLTALKGQVTRVEQRLRYNDDGTEAKTIHSKVIASYMIMLRNSCKVH